MSKNRQVYIIAMTLLKGIKDYSSALYRQGNLSAGVFFVYGEWNTRLLRSNSSLIP